MDGESVPVWLNFGVGKGLLCSPRLSRVSRFAAARLLLGCRAARGSPSSCAPTERQGCPAKATNTWPEAGGALVLHLATENDLRLCKATSRRKSRGSPHHCATKARSPHPSGKGQGKGPGAKRHSLHLALLGSGISTGSSCCPTLSCLGSSAQHWFPAGAAGPRLPQPPGLRLLPQHIPPGENAAPTSLGLVPGGYPGLKPPRREARLPAKPLPGVLIARLLAIASSWLIS